MFVYIDRFDRWPASRDVVFRLSCQTSSSSRASVLSSMMSFLPSSHLSSAAAIQTFEMCFSSDIGQYSFIKMRATYGMLAKV